jgi:hypothetical protein
VERILRQQRAERQAAEEAARAARPQSTALVSDTASISSIPGGFEKPAPPIPVASKPMPQLPASTSASISSYDSTPTLLDDTVPEELSSKSGRPHSMISQFNNLKSKFTKKGSNSPLPGAGLLPGMSSDVGTSSGSGPSANPSGHVTPLTNISMFLCPVTYSTSNETCRCEHPKCNKGVPTRDSRAYAKPGADADDPRDSGRWLLRCRR